jgi:predicted esterase YcpF (UPF0227 family)
MKVLYIHGYGGSPYGNSYQLFKEAFSDGVELLTIDYDVNKPVETLVDIRDYVETNHIDLVIASSLGGFFAMNLCGVSRIVVNPCWNPAEEIPKLGYNGDTKCYEMLLNSMIDSLDFEEKNLCSGVFANDDVLLGKKYVDVFKRYFAAQYDIVGGHRISQQMAHEIINRILPLHEHDATDFAVKLKTIDNAPWL